MQGRWGELQEDFAWEAGEQVAALLGSCHPPSPCTCSSASTAVCIMQMGKKHHGGWTTGSLRSLSPRAEKDAGVVGCHDCKSFNLKKHNDLPKNQNKTNQNKPQMSQGQQNGRCPTRQGSSGWLPLVPGSVPRAAPHTACLCPLPPHLSLQWLRASSSLP